MQLKAERWKVTTELGIVELAHQIFDDGNLRRIAVVAERPLLLGFGKRKFAGALELKLSCERLSSYQIADLYDSSG